MLYRVQKENVTDFSFLWNNNTSSAFSLYAGKLYYLLIRRKLHISPLLIDEFRSKIINLQ